MYPNPAGDQATFFWQPPSAGLARLRVFNLAGQKVAEIESQTAGLSALVWDTRRVSPGVYLGQLEVRTAENTLKTVLKVAVKK